MCKILYIIGMNQSIYEFRRISKRWNGITFIAFDGHNLIPYEQCSIKVSEYGVEVNLQTSGLTSEETYQLLRQMSALLEDFGATSPAFEWQYLNQRGYTKDTRYSLLKYDIPLLVAVPNPITAKNIDRAVSPLFVPHAQYDFEMVTPTWECLG